MKIKTLFTYINSVYDIGKKFNTLKRRNVNINVKTKAKTPAKMILTNFLCHNKSLNELIMTNKNRFTKYKGLFEAREYVPKMHGLRDCIIDTNYKQIEAINDDVVIQMKKNKIFEKNTIDGLRAMAWDGVELCETDKEIQMLPEREHSDGKINKYIKYEVAMNIGERGNFFVAAKQLTEREKITSKSGKEKAKTIGEITAFEEMWNDVEKKVGGVIDVHVLDAIYLNQRTTNLINDSGKFFVIRLKDESRLIYKDAKGLFESRNPNNVYEIVEITQTKKIKYDKRAKRKDQFKSKIKTIQREITGKEIGKRILTEKKETVKKNSTVTTCTYEKVVKTKEVWDDKFELTGYKDKVRVVRALEKNTKKTYEIYVVTNLLDHDVETIIKIMHLRWHIENNGFRTLKEQYNIDHIFIGEYNAINYIFFMALLAHNLLEVYKKFRLKLETNITFQMQKKMFESQLHTSTYCLFNTC